MRTSGIARGLLVTSLLLILSTTALAQVRITVAFAPPPIPVYEQPLCPAEGYIWVPGYWAWDADLDDYYWVPGTWVLAPEVGFLWTPPWWGWEDGVFVFHEGFWGPVVGFYGGINYGFGYFGTGYVGGRWDSGRFYYNQSVTNVNVTVIRNVYNERVDIRNESHVSFNGGQGGIDTRPTPAEEAAARDRHLPPVEAQRQHVEAARSNPDLRAATNHGKPPVAATARPGELRGSSVIAAREAGGVYHRPEKASGTVPRASDEMARHPVHPRDLPPLNPPEANSQSSEAEKKFQQQHKLIERQNKEREKLERQQEKDHAQLERQNANEARRQEMEQRHAQQTQAMQQRHEMQMRDLQSRSQGRKPE